METLDTCTLTLPGRSSSLRVETSRPYPTSHGPTWSFYGQSTGSQQPCSISSSRYVLPTSPLPHIHLTPLTLPHPAQLLQGRIYPSSIFQQRHSPRQIQKRRTTHHHGDKGRNVHPAGPNVHRGPNMHRIHLHSTCTAPPSQSDACTSTPIRYAARTAAVDQAPQTASTASQTSCAALLCCCTAAPARCSASTQKNGPLYKQWGFSDRAVVSPRPTRTR